MTVKETEYVYPIFVIFCPVRGHEHIQIGEWAGELDQIVHQGFHCRACKKIKKFDRESFKNYLQKGLFKPKFKTT